MRGGGGRKGEEVRGAGGRRVGCGAGGLRSKGALARVLVCERGRGAAGGDIVRCRSELRQLLWVGWRAVCACQQQVRSCKKARIGEEKKNGGYAARLYLYGHSRLPKLCDVKYVWKDCTF